LVYHDAEGVNVHDLGEGLALGPHLFVNAVEVFFAAEHTRRHAFTFQTGFERALDLLDDLLAVAAHALHGRIDTALAHRIQRIETELLELDAHGIHAQPVGDGGVDVQGL